MAGRRSLLLLLLITLVICECVSAKKKKAKPCKYNGKKIKAGMVVESLPKNCVDLRCSKKGKKMELALKKGCTCCKEVPKPPKPTAGPTSAPTEAPTTDCDYSNFGASHTMNLAKNSDCSPHKNGITDDEKATILQKHNELRARVANGLETLGNPGPQPTAMNMREMRWNSQLAEVAQAWAEQCPGGHDTSDNRKICDPDYYVGQNMYWSWSFNPASKWADAVDSWYGEVKDMPSSLVDSFGSPPSGVIGHYTQVVWAETYEVGCGSIHYEDTLQGTTFPQSKAYVCNYGKGGNWLNSKVYESGATATNCPNGPSTAYPGLCK